MVGPRVMGERHAADFRGSFSGAYQARPLEAPLGLAQHLVLGAVEYARGSSPATGLAATTDQLGRGRVRAPSGSGATVILLRRGPAQRRLRVLQTLERSVGRGDFAFLVQA